MHTTIQENAAVVEKLLPGIGTDVCRQSGGGGETVRETLAVLPAAPYPTHSIVVFVLRPQRSVEESKKQRSGIGELFANRGNIKAVCISCAMVAGQQLSGINVVLLFSQIIFSRTGADISASLSTIIVGSVMLLAAGATPPLAKLTSMRTLLYVSSIGMAVTDVRSRL